MIHLKSYKIFEATDLGFDVDDNEDYHDYSNPYTEQEEKFKYVLKLTWGHHEHDTNNHIKTNDKKEFEAYLAFYLDMLNWEKNIPKTNRKWGYDDIGMQNMLWKEDDLLAILKKNTFLSKGVEYLKDRLRDLIDWDYNSNEPGSLDGLQAFVDGQKRRIISAKAFKLNQIKLPKIGDKIETTTGKLIGGEFGNHKFPNWDELEEAGFKHTKAVSGMTTVTNQVGNEVRRPLKQQQAVYAPITGTVVSVEQTPSNAMYSNEYKIIFSFTAPNGEIYYSSIGKKGFA